jgi:1-acyl-sn-glycerol-3-phosphate acyltransferase
MIVAAMNQHEATFGDQRDLAVVDGVLDRLEGPLERWFRPVVKGLDRAPNGPSLVVANHNGGVLMPDVWMIACAWRRARGSSDIPYALGHDAAMSAPYLGPLLTKLGGLRATKQAGEALFAAGKKILVFPGGDLENMRPFRDRDRIVFDQRRGYVRFALRHGVPITPVVTSGAHSGMVVLDDGRRIAKALGFTKLRIHVCPTVLSIPWGITIGFPPPYLPLPIQTRIEVLAPVTFSRSGEAAAADDTYVEQCHDEIVRRMQAALERLSTERRIARRQKIDEVIDGAIERVLERLLGPKAAVTALDPARAGQGRDAEVRASPEPLGLAAE